MITGVWLSVIVTIVLHTLLFPLLSVTLNDKIEFPTGKISPELSPLVKTAVKPGLQLSDTGGKLYVTVASHIFSSVSKLKVSVQVIIGLRVSSTVTLNEQEFVKPKVLSTTR